MTISDLLQALGMESIKSMDTGTGGTTGSTSAYGCASTSSTSTAGETEAFGENAGAGHPEEVLRQGSLTAQR